MSNVCKCGKYRDRRVAGPNSSFPGRAYFCCDDADCRQFDWADDGNGPSSPGEQRRRSQAAITGPECKCGKATVQRAVKKESPNKGRKFWSCASWPRGCQFFEWQEENNTPPNSAAKTSRTSAEADKKKRPALPGYASYETDWQRKQLLQKLLDSGVDHTKLKVQSDKAWDSYELQEAWKINNPSRMEKYSLALERERKKAGSENYSLPSDYLDVMRFLGMDSMKYNEAGEVFLLHGTSPENLHSILFEGLDPQVAGNGKFGRGVYFAENAAKMDQYTTEDRRFDKDGELKELHKQLYEHTNHPRRVRYCLVARVVLGRPQRTKDDREVLNRANSQLFEDNRRSNLKSFDDGIHPSSLIGEVGGINNSFREFIVFNPDQIFVEYVIAYLQVRRYCDCGKLAMKRTVSKQTENRGRGILLCGNDRACNFIRMFPLCDCNDSAGIKTSQSARNPGRKYYTCNNRRCDFFAWCEEAAGTFSSPYKKQRYS